MAVDPHGSPHLNIGVGGFRSCICACRECASPDYRCRCPECDCTRSDMPLHPAYYPPKAEEIEHACKTCGKEVFRRSNRGRWPTYCPSCKLARSENDEA